MTAAEEGPLAGRPLVVVLRQLEATVWWGEDAHGRDVVATAGGRVLSWPSPAECLAAVEADGWDNAAPGEQAARMDLTPAVEWHARQRHALDPEAALNAWNLAGDVARSVGAPWGDRGRVADACHDKLTAACVPWLVEREHYSPRWSVAEERYLRRRLGVAFTLLVEQLGGRPLRGAGRAHV